MVRAAALWGLFRALQTCTPYAQSLSLPVPTRCDLYGSSTGWRPVGPYLRHRRVVGGCVATSPWGRRARER